MMKKVVGSLLVLSLILLPMAASADLGQVVGAKDIEIKMMGALKTLPMFVDNPDFNSKDTNLDRILDENGWMSDHDIRMEARVGWMATAKDWDFMMILEADFNVNKANVDRQTGVNNVNAAAWNPNAITANSDTFGIEKINFGYDFGPMKLNAGWNTKFVDLMTGGLIYADDHPYLGLAGKFGAKNVWEVLYLTVQDDISGTNGFWDGDTLDWRAYTARVGFNVNGFNVAPIYAYSDNNMREAQTHYLGVEGFGTTGIFTPRFELVYAVGNKDTHVAGKKVEYDISAFAAYASLDIAISKALVPYFGGYYLSGDDDKNDKDINAYNGIAMNQRYTPTFGMENAFIYKFVPALGSFLYENGFQNLGTQAGYGGSSNGQCADAPGLIMLGAGLKGAINEQLDYKTQLMYFAIAEENNFKKIGTTKNVDKEVGWEYDLQLTYKFNSHFSLGNVVSVFLPSDFVEDYRGKDYDSMAFMDTIEMNWAF
ncbi:MAG: hypothetical protein V2B19_00845 [Pseudomonadota bacterium]